MKYALVVLVLFTQLCLSQSVSHPYEVGTWQGFRHAAITYTFDDLSANHLKIAVPMFNTFGYPLTLFVVTNWTTDWMGLQAAALQGHEVASHTVTHTKLSTLSDSLQSMELQCSQAAIDSHIVSQHCATLAYPYCDPGDTVLSKDTYIASRICSGLIEPATPPNFTKISSIGCGSLSSVNTAGAFQQQADAAADANGWCVYLVHGIDNDGGYSSLSSDTLKAGLEYLHAHPDVFWVSSFGNVAKYIRERNAVSVKELLCNDDTMTVQITDTLDRSVYTMPITIRRPLPAGWSGAAASQSGHNLSVQFVNINTTKYIIFDVIPNNATVVISNTGR